MMDVDFGLEAAAKEKKVGFIIVEAHIYVEPMCERSFHLLKLLLFATQVCR